MRRRTFLKETVLGSAAASMALARSLLAGNAAPSKRVRAAFVGVGGRAGRLLKYFAEQPDVEIVALAEIDQRRIPAAMNLLAEQKEKAPTVVGDFRRLLDDSSIDVLVVGTPDHWHAIPTIMACQAGKDVYAEKNRLVAEGKCTTDATPHVRNFIDCVKSRQRPNADLEQVGHPSSVMCHMANVAWRVGRQLEFDPTTEMFIDTQGGNGDQEANALRSRPEYRKPSVLPEV